MSKQSKKRERITIMLDDDLAHKLRLYQANMIRISGKTFSFSSAINDILKKGFDNKK